MFVIESCTGLGLIKGKKCVRGRLIIFEERTTRKRSREVNPVALHPANRISRQTSDNNPKKSKRGQRKYEKTYNKYLIR